ncbi:MAG: DUF1810 domain-containing protein [Chitinophagaceae bacterium]|nr:DUF1810 domain-containing protein [Chitinophagaceae bacterium]
MVKKDLGRFIKVQETDYAIALAEIRSGKKSSHWMWYIFPQLCDLGHSDISLFYAIADLKEATEYLDHPVLGFRLREIASELLRLEQTNASLIFGFPDDVKLRSSMTLFAIADGSADNIFKKVIDRYFKGQFDQKTLDLLQHQEKSEQ